MIKTEITSHGASGKRGYINYFSPKVIGIEMKSRGEDLEAALETLLKDYILPLSGIDSPYSFRRQ